jgi:hypothetical protein
MQRRSLLAALAGASLAGSAQAAGEDKRAIIELTYVWMRTGEGQQSRRMRRFLSDSLVPALKRAGSGPVGLFSSVIGMKSPSLLVVSRYSNLAGRDEVAARLQEDKEAVQAADEFYSQPEPAFERMDKVLLRGFQTVPDIEAPPTSEDRPPRVFELRIYESDSPATLARKVEMFNEGEIALFRKNGLLPIFFGETIIGAGMPSIAYLIACDNWAARETNWAAFRGDPGWAKVQSNPRYGAPGLVSNITNTMLEPLPASDIR